MKKFVEKMKNFLSMNAEAKSGFTLVELIVVIAILAILAGVAIPAYSGYVEKAKKAEDEQLLAAVNTAFAAACAENGTDTYNVVDKEKKTPKLSYVNAPYTVDIYQEAFDNYYAGNDTAEFQANTTILFDTLKGAFVIFDDGSTITWSYGGGYVTLDFKDIAALRESTFLTAETLNGSSGLLDKVNYVTDVAAVMAGGHLSTVFNDPDFIASAMNALGVSTAEEYTAKQEKMIVQLLANNPGMTREQAIAKIGANAAVLYASQNAMNFTDDQIDNLFSTTGVDIIKENLTTTGKTTDGMAQAALIYGMYTAYANSEEFGNASLQGQTENPIAVLNALENDDNFKKYVSSEQGQKDLDAYLGALGIISDSAASNPSAVEHLMVNGFNNAELKDLVASSTGR